MKDIALLKFLSMNESLLHYKCRKSKIVGFLLCISVGQVQVVEEIPVMPIPPIFLTIKKVGMRAGDDVDGLVLAFVLEEEFGCSFQILLTGK